MLAKAKAEGVARRAKWIAPGTTPGTTEGTQMFIDGTIVLTFDELVVLMEADNEGYCHTTYAFYQNEIQVDVTGLVDHACNQSHTRLDRFDILCDNQSTSHVIVERSFVRNIRTCKWTLVLKTQAGVCRIDQIADLPGVGTVWFYPDGVANILSMNKLIMGSGWDIDFSTRGYRRTNDVRDLAYKCETSEGVKVEFIPTQQGLHIMNCSDYFGLDKSGCVFGTEVTDNGTGFGEHMGRPTGTAHTH